MQLSADVDVPAELRDVHCIAVSDQDRLLGGLAHLSAKGIGARAPVSIPVHPRGQPSRAAYLSERRTNTPHRHVDAIESKSLRPGRGKTSDFFSRNKAPLGPIVGIDFGTTNSLCAVQRGAVPELIPNRLGNRSTPSAAYVQSNGKIVTGEPAVAAILRDPQHGVLQVKRLFGTGCTLKVYGRSYSAAQLAGAILADLRTDCEAFLREDCRLAVVTSPAYFGERQMDELHEACALAGLDIVRVVAEPTAASLAYRRRAQDGEKIAVFDLGGGTFDVSILEIDVQADQSGLVDTMHQIMAVNGDSFLGGTDYDQALVEHCLARFYEQTGINIAGNLIAEMRIRDAAERAKIELTSAPSATVYVPFVFANASGAFDLLVPITRSDFNNLTCHLTSRILECCQQTLTASRLAKGQVDRLLMIGLATRTPMILHKAEELFGLRASVDLDPDAAVALGAAIQAAILRGDEKNALLLDVTPHDLGLETEGGVMTTVVARNRTIPLETGVELCTTRDDQSSTLVSILEGNRPLAVDNECLSRFVVDQFTSASAGKSRIQFVFEIDANRALTVTAKDLTSGRLRTVQVSREPVYEEKSDYGVWGDLTETPLTNR